MNLLSWMTYVRGFLWICAVLLALLLLGFAVLQTRFAKEAIREKLVASFQEAHIRAEIPLIEGRLPFNWQMRSIRLEFASLDTLLLENVTIRIAIAPLFKGRCEISYLHASSGAFVGGGTQTPTSFQGFKEALRERLNTAQLPFPFSLERFQIDVFALGEHGLFGISGKVKLHRKQQEIQARLFSPTTHQIYFEGLFHSNTARNEAELSAQMRLGELSQMFRLPLTFQGSLNLSGPWVAWKELIAGKSLSTTPLKGSLKGHFLQVSIPEAPLMNRDWSVKSAFSLSSLDALVINGIALDSDFLSLKGKGTLQSDFQESELLASFNIKDLARLNLSSMTGLAKGKVLYDKRRIRCQIKTTDLHIQDAQLGEIKAILEGSYSQGALTAHVQASSKEVEYPLTLSSVVEYTPSSFRLKDLNFSSSAGSLEGGLDYDSNRHLVDSRLCFSLGKLEDIAPLFGQKAVRGALSGELTLFSSEGVQGVKCALKGHLLRYKDILVDDFALNCSVTDWIGANGGELSLEAEKIYMRGFYLNSLSCNTEKKEAETWDFSLEAGGRVEGPFTLFSQGSWSYVGRSFEMRLDQLLGTLSGVAFQSENPIFLRQSPEESKLTPIAITMGQGYLHAACALSQERAHATLDMAHFPLEMLRFLRPQLALDGYISASGFLDAGVDKIQGALNATLENASVTQFGKENPLQAKGSIQLHLNQETLQAHCDLKASDGQFLDLSATLPLDYDLHPFSLRLNTKKSVSAELIAEGKLEELFDFVNLGINHFTGLISCRLFLSGILSSPALQGPIDWQNGSYENDFTGISLQAIQSKLEAQNDTIRALSVTATDKETGVVKAHGQMALTPLEHFPFVLEAEMSHLHAVQFDMIDAHVSGVTKLSGNTQGLLIQGQLIVDEGLVRLTEQLPYDIPSIPFTYVNKPIDVDPHRIHMGPQFAFHLDLDVNSNGTVKVEGRGIEALLEGHVHLEGINAQITASGAFKLVKGEYIFAGKVFKLTEAELVFNDKPSFSSYLNVEGTLSLPDSVITVIMRGPLMAPQITLQSNPHKSTSSILALILFNKDISEISHGEAIQLASTLISLSGGAGPDVLASIRKNLGVDRLNIVSNPSNDEIAVQIGKYLFRGVLITLSQSATSSQVIVEVELPKGFVFQAETQEEEEGKFSLKWRKSY